MRLLPAIPHDPAQSVNWLFLDLNAYFASVEQQERPELRGVPIGIVPIVTEHTCCIALSYEAKAYGLKGGASVEQAKRMCPNIQFIEARPKLYTEYHYRIVEAVNNCIPVSHVMSVDEMACRLMGRERALQNAKTLATDIKQAIRKVGNTLRCSIGLAPNRYLAKVASDMQKPDGLTVLLQQDLPQALYGMKLSDLVGIGSSMERRILSHGITTIEELCRLTPAQMRGIWGSVLGERLWHWLRGADFHDPESAKKSLGKQHVLAPEYRTREKAFGVAMKMLHTTATNLRKLKMWAGGIAVNVYFVNRDQSRRGYEPVWNAALRISECRDTITLQKYLTELWKACPDREPMQVSVWLFNLCPDESHTMSLFENDEKNFRLCNVVDALNKRYGLNAVHFGGVHAALDAAPTRIPFSTVPKMDEF